jgi:uncharacterized repeat protein (TIGR01451 family)
MSSALSSAPAPRRRAVLLVVPLTIASFLAVAPGVSAAATAPGAAAEAYGLMVDVQLLAQNIPVATGEISHASQDYPPGAQAPAEDSVLEAGPIPDDGSLVKHVGVLTAMAGASGQPQGLALAEVADVSLLVQDGAPTITADVVRAMSESDCTKAPNATGTTFVNLSIGGQPIDGTPPPNTVIDLQIAKVILNEQHPASDGRGFVVNAIHVISTTAGDPLLRGDIVVAHAVSTVSCPGGPGSTGGQNEVQITKTVSPETAAPGDTLTYTAKITNKAAQPCLVTKAIDHLPVGFTFVSTSGDLGNALDVSPPEARPGGGLDLVLGNGKTIAPNATATQTFVVKVGAQQAPGVYYNDVEVYCANLGNYVKGLDAPVTVPPPGSTTGGETTGGATTGGQTTGGATTGGETTGGETSGEPPGLPEPGPVLAPTGLDEPVSAVVLLVLGTGAALFLRRRFARQS